MSDKTKIVNGQRWMSEAEPELGLGTVIAVHEGKIKIRFTTSGVTRQYSITRAPIKRIRFKPGDILTCAGEAFEVDGIIERNGLLYYRHSNVEFCETGLADTIPFHNPLDRLLAFDFDPGDTFQLRHETLFIRENLMKSPVKGFCGARIDLIPHQLYIADAVSNRHLPRVMLSDQVGLGKTIEASLIINRLILTNRIKNILIIVPEHLVLQWFGELYHRFNLSVSVIDEQYCLERYEEEPMFDPFDERQFCICSYPVLKRIPELRDLSLTKNWDMVLVDEVHNLHQSSEEYGYFKMLSELATGLMLLTAIPEYPNLEDFFARLHLIDPVHYAKYEHFFWEIDRYKWVAGLSERVRKNKKLSGDHIRFLQENIPTDYLEKNVFEGNDVKLDKKTRRKVLDYLIDQHGMGRLLFRNTRKTISGFPERVVHPVALGREPDKIKSGRLFTEFKYDINELERQPDYYFKEDLRVKWLLTLLEKGEKVLLICTSKSKVQALKAALKVNGFRDFLCFHEDIEFLERDRRVALFFKEEGPRLLLSSEIGSEGRNFQFCRNLVLFDIPFDPSLIEQRIGRLDRIGQKGPVNIFIPYADESAQAILVNWFHSGLNIFNEFHDGHNQTFSVYSSYIKNMALSGNYNAAELEHIICETKKEYTKIKKKNEKGRDILVELNSFDKSRAKQIIDNICHEDENTGFEKCIIDLLEFYGFYQEKIDHRTYLLNTGEVINSVFSQLVPDGFIMTFDRKTATKRTDYAFITIDHELAARATDFLLGQSTGNCTYAMWFGTGEQDMLFEILYVLECIAPPEYNTGRFLPITPIRVLVNQNLEDLTDKFSYEMICQETSGYDSKDHSGLVPPVQKSAKEMAAKAITFAERKAFKYKQSAIDNVEQVIGAEIIRLGVLKKINAHINEEEVLEAAREMTAVKGYISSARLRMDSIRVIQKVLK